MPSSTFPWLRARPQANQARPGLAGEDVIIVDSVEELMGSDQAVLGIIADELYELNAIRHRLGTSSISKADLQRFINDIHCQNSKPVSKTSSKHKMIKRSVPASNAIVRFTYPPHPDGLPMYLRPDVWFGEYIQMAFPIYLLYKTT